VLATWYVHAKLHLHTETTLRLFEQTTAMLGTLLRHFVSVTCVAFKTKELPQEEATCRQRKAAQVAKKATSAITSTGDKTGKQLALLIENTKDKVFSLSTFKLHSLGDYV